LLSTSKKGAIGELTATVWLLAQGYEVFRNVAADGPVDLIATKGGELIKIDVKKAVLSQGKDYPYKEHFVANLHAKGIRLLLVGSNGVCQWQDPKGD
jgi:Holliday junction resolvase